MTAQDENRRRRESLAAKLRLTAAVLGCATHKELSARFRAVNPATEFDLERSYKWSQGRALPRSTAMYIDWIRVLGSERTNDWLAHCTIEEFLTELQALHGIDGAVLLQRSRLTTPESTRNGDASFGPAQYIVGAYACYSVAWSGYFRGKMIRGALIVEPGHGSGSPAATYFETISIGRCKLQGSVQLQGRSVFLYLRDAASQLPIMITLYLPAPPANSMVGLLTGVTLVGQDPEPSAGRIVMVKVPVGSDQLDATNRYIEPNADAVSADLAVLGLPLADSEIGALVLGCIYREPQPGFDQLRREEILPLAAALDRLQIAHAS